MQKRKQSLRDFLKGNNQSRKKLDVRLAGLLHSGNHSALVKLLNKGDDPNGGLKSSWYSLTTVMSDVCECLNIRTKIKMFNSLVKYEANPYCKTNDGMNLLGLATFKHKRLNNYRIIKTLVGIGINPNEKCFRDIFPIEMAEANADKKTVRLLKQLGAKEIARNKKDRLKIYGVKNERN